MDPVPTVSISEGRSHGYSPLHKRSQTLSDLTAQAKASLKDGIRYAAQSLKRLSFCAPKECDALIEKAVASVDAAIDQMHPSAQVMEDADTVKPEPKKQVVAEAQVAAEVAAPRLGKKQMMGLMQQEWLKQQEAERAAAQQPEVQVAAPQQDRQRRLGVYSKVPLVMGEVDADELIAEARQNERAAQPQPQVMVDDEQDDSEALAALDASAHAHEPALAAAPVLAAPAAPVIEGPMQGCQTPDEFHSEFTERTMEGIKKAIEKTTGDIKVLEELGLAKDDKAIGHLKGELEKLCRTQSALIDAQRNIEQAKDQLKVLQESRVKILRREPLLADNVEKMKKKARATWAAIRCAKKQVVYHRFLKEMNAAEISCKEKELEAHRQLFERLGAGFLEDPTPKQKECAGELSRIKRAFHIDQQLINGKLQLKKVTVGGVGAAKLNERFTAQGHVMHYPTSLSETDESDFWTKMSALNKLIDQNVTSSTELSSREEQVLSLMDKHCQEYAQVLYKIRAGQIERNAFIKANDKKHYESIRSTIEKNQLHEDAITALVGEYRLGLLNKIDREFSDLIDEDRLNAMIDRQEALNRVASRVSVDREVLKSDKQSTGFFSPKKKVAQLKKTRQIKSTRKLIRQEHSFRKLGRVQSSLTLDADQEAVGQE